MLPRLKQASHAISFNELKRIDETMEIVWDRYFSVGEEFDLAYEIGIIYYDLGFYKEALIYYQHSIDLHESNMALSH